MSTKVWFLICGVFTAEATHFQISRSGNMDDNINLTLKTVLDLDNKDLTANVNFFDRVENIIDNVKTAIYKNDFLRRGFSDDNLENFSDFILITINVLNKYEDSDLEDFFDIVNVEIRKYKYKDCKFHELLENEGLKTFIANKLDEFGNIPASAIRKILLAVASKIEEEKYGAKERELVDLINSLYGKDYLKTFQKLLINIDDYRQKTRRNLDLVKIVRGGLRTLLFDHYTKLHYNVRAALRSTINEYWKYFSDVRSSPILRIKIHEDKFSNQTFSNSASKFKKHNNVKKLSNHGNLNKGKGLELKYAKDRPTTVEEWQPYESQIKNKQDTSRDDSDDTTLSIEREEERDTNETPNKHHPDVRNRNELDSVQIGPKQTDEPRTLKQMYFEEDPHTNDDSNDHSTTPKTKSRYSTKHTSLDPELAADFTTQKSRVKNKQISYTRPQLRIQTLWQEAEPLLTPNEKMQTVSKHKTFTDDVTVTPGVIISRTTKSKKFTDINSLEQQINNESTDHVKRPKIHYHHSSRPIGLLLADVPISRLKKLDNVNIQRKLTTTETPAKRFKILNTGTMNHFTVTPKKEFADSLSKEKLMKDSQSESNDQYVSTDSIIIDKLILNRILQLENELKNVKTQVNNDTVLIENLKSKLAVSEDESDPNKPQKHKHTNKHKDFKSFYANYHSNARITRENDKKLQDYKQNNKAYGNERYQIRNDEETKQRQYYSAPIDNKQFITSVNNDEGFFKRDEGNNWVPHIEDINKKNSNFLSGTIEITNDDDRRSLRSHKMYDPHSQNIQQREQNNRRFDSSKAESKSNRGGKYYFNRDTERMGKCYNNPGRVMSETSMRRTFDKAPLTNAQDSDKDCFARVYDKKYYLDNYYNRNSMEKLKRDRELNVKAPVRVYKFDDDSRNDWKYQNQHHTGLKEEQKDVFRRDNDHNHNSKEKLNRDRELNVKAPVRVYKFDADSRNDWKNQNQEHPRLKEEQKDMLLLENDNNQNSKEKPNRDREMNGKVPVRINKFDADNRNDWKYQKQHHTGLKEEQKDVFRRDNDHNHNSKEKLNRDRELNVKAPVRVYKFDADSRNDWKNQNQDHPRLKEEQKDMLFLENDNNQNSKGKPNRDREMNGKVPVRVYNFDADSRNDWKNQDEQYTKLKEEQKDMFRRDNDNNHNAEEKLVHDREMNGKAPVTINKFDTDTRNDWRNQEHPRLKEEQNNTFLLENYNNHDSKEKLNHDRGLNVKAPVRIFKFDADAKNNWESHEYPRLKEEEHKDLFPLNIRRNNDGKIIHDSSRIMSHQNINNFKEVGPVIMNQERNPAAIYKEDQEEHRVLLYDNRPTENNEHLDFNRDMRNNGFIKSRTKRSAAADVFEEMLRERELSLNRGSRDTEHSFNTNIFTTYTDIPSLDGGNIQTTHGNIIAHLGKYFDDSPTMFEPFLDKVPLRDYKEFGKDYEHPFPKARGQFKVDTHLLGDTTDTYVFKEDRVKNNLTPQRRYMQDSKLVPVIENKAHNEYKGSSETTKGVEHFDALIENDWNKINPDLMFAEILGKNPNTQDKTTLPPTTRIPIESIQMMKRRRLYNSFEESTTEFRSTLFPERPFIFNSNSLMGHDNIMNSGSDLNGGGRVHYLLAPPPPGSKGEISNNVEALARIRSRLRLGRNVTRATEGIDTFRNKINSLYKKWGTVRPQTKEHKPVKSGRRNMDFEALNNRPAGGIVEDPFLEDFEKALG